MGSLELYVTKQSSTPPNDNSPLQSPKAAVYPHQASLKSSQFRKIQIKNKAANERTQLEYALINMSMNIDSNSEVGTDALFTGLQSPGSASLKAQTDKLIQKRVMSSKIRKEDGREQLDAKGQMPIVGSQILNP